MQFLFYRLKYSQFAEEEYVKIPLVQRTKLKNLQTTVPQFKEYASKKMTLTKGLKLSYKLMRIYIDCQKHLSIIIVYYGKYFNTLSNFNRYI